jgi:hypothetical protein
MKLNYVESMEKEEYESYHKVKFYYNQEDRLNRIRIEKKGIDPKVLSRRRRRNTFLIVFIDLLLVLIIIYVAGEKIEEYFYESPSILEYDDLQFRMSYTFFDNQKKISTLLYISNLDEDTKTLSKNILSHIFFFYISKINHLSIVNTKITNSTTLKPGGQYFYKQDLDIRRNVSLIGIAIPKPDLNESKLQRLQQWTQTLNDNINSNNSDFLKTINLKSSAQQDISNEDFSNQWFDYLSKQNFVYIYKKL